VRLKFQKLIGKLGMFSWSLHNLIAHPVSELLFWVGLGKAGNWLHDVTLPIDSTIEPRG